MPRVSIVIPAKNEGRILPKLLASIRAQMFRDYEVILADAQSTDDTVAIATQFGAQVVAGGLPGPGRNRGAAQARGDIIIFFDADVQLPGSKFLHDCIAEMDRKKLDIATCKVKPLSRKPIDRALHEVYNAYVQVMEQLKPHAPGFCIFVRKKTHEDLNGFDERIVFCEDHEYVQRAQKKGYRFGVLRSAPIAVSVRRLEKDGRLILALKYLFGELHLMTKGAFTELPFPYEMGGGDTHDRRQAADDRGGTGDNDA